MSSAGAERVLVVDDDPLMLRLVKTNLDREGFQVIAAARGQEAIDLASVELPDLVILDLMLPDIDGYEVCQRLRQFSMVPIVMLTARGEQVDKLSGFEVGADDYLTKPFAPAELLARVRAVLRRTRMGEASMATPIVQCGELVVDFVKYRVTVRGQPVRLTPTEFRLLEQLALHVGKVLTHTELLTRVWGPEYLDDRDYLWAYVRHLRRKLEDDPEHPRLILSEPGIGYVLQCPTA
jgi:DNA-binding response OmpR family regulator